MAVLETPIENATALDWAWMTSYSSQMEMSWSFGARWEDRVSQRVPGLRARLKAASVVMGSTVLLSFFDGWPISLFGAVSGRKSLALLPL